MKLYQKFTHPLMFREAAAEAAPRRGRALAGRRPAPCARPTSTSSRRGIEPLADAGKLGPLLVQFPPSFTATPEAIDYLGWLLRTFGDYALAVELRHRTWSDQERDTAGAAGRLRRRLGAHRRTEVRVLDPAALERGVSHQCRRGRPTDDLAYMRFHGRNAAEWWRHAAAEDRYNYLYTEQELRPFAAAAASAGASLKKAYLFFNNHFSAQGVANAVQLRRQLGHPVSRAPAPRSRRALPLARPPPT